MSALENFYRNLKDLRQKDKGLVAKICKVTGKSASLITGYCKGVGEPGLGAAEDVAKALGYSLTQFIGETLPPPPEPRKPTALEIAIYLFENGAPEADKRAVGLFKKALTGSEAQLKVLEDYVEGMFESVVDSPESGAGTDGSGL